jgi:glycosyltransferase involved in cell wall biosynthesis
MKKVAIVYDRVNSRGGAEKVLQELHALYPNAPLYTSVYESGRARWAKGWDVRPSFLQRIPFLRTRHQLVGWLMPLVFETLDLSEFDTVISVTSEFCKGVVTLPHQLHVSYILTPTRYLWSHSGESLETIPFFLRPLAQSVFGFLRKYDYAIARRPDALVSISQLVASRVEKYYGMHSEVMYPPYQSLPAAQVPQKRPPWNDFVLTWGRLVPYKRFSHVMKACVQAQTPLVVVGDGPDFSRLTALARELDPQKEWIFFAGYQKDENLSWYLKHALACIFPQIEDFGIAPLEARLAGCPIITQKLSGSSELIGNGVGVYYLESENDENIVAYLKEIWRTPANRLDIRRQARQYAGARWRHDWSSVMNAIQGSAHKMDQDKGNRKGL